MNRRPLHSRNRPAFTLLEVILAIAMTATLVVSLYASLSIAFRARETIQRQSAGPQLATIAMNAIQRDIESALAPGGSLATNFIGIDSGTTITQADTIEFFTIGSDVTGIYIEEQTHDPLAEGVRWVQLSLRTDLDPPALVRKVERNLLTSTIVEPTEEILLSGVLALSMRYLDGSVWTDEWDSTLNNNALPLAVEITIELDEASPADPDLNYRLTRVVPLSTANFEAFIPTE